MFTTYPQPNETPVVFFNDLDILFESDSWRLLGRIPLLFSIRSNVKCCYVVEVFGKRLKEYTFPGFAPMLLNKWLHVETWVDIFKHLVHFVYPCLDVDPFFMGTGKNLEKVF